MCTHMSPCQHYFVSKASSWQQKSRFGHMSWKCNAQQLNRRKQFLSSSSNSLRIARDLHLGIDVTSIRQHHCDKRRDQLLFLRLGDGPQTEFREEVIAQRGAENAVAEGIAANCWDQRFHIASTATRDFPCRVIVDVLKQPLLRGLPFCCVVPCPSNQHHRLTVLPQFGNGGLLYPRWKGCIVPK